MWKIRFLRKDVKKQLNWTMVVMMWTTVGNERLSIRKNQSVHKETFGQCE